MWLLLFTFALFSRFVDCLTYGLSVGLFTNEPPSTVVAAIIYAVLTAFHKEILFYPFLSCRPFFHPETLVFFFSPVLLDKCLRSL